MKNELGPVAVAKDVAALLAITAVIAVVVAVLAAKEISNPRPYWARWR